MWNEPAFREISAVAAQLRRAPRSFAITVPCSEARPSQSIVAQLRLTSGRLGVSTPGIGHPANVCGNAHLVIRDARAAAPPNFD